MKRYKSLAVVAGVIAALVATALTALASGAGMGRAAATLNSPPADIAAASCTKIKASDIIWVTLDDEGQIDEQVDFYPSGTSLLVPVFEYDCVPNNTTLVTVFTYDGEQVYNDKEKLKATNSQGTYGYPLEMTDGVFDDGEWGVEFYNNKTLLTSGTVLVGDENAETPVSETVTVQGMVTDKRTKKPIKDALIIILNPGVTVEDFVDTQAEEDIYSAAKTNSRGQFVLEEQLEREVEYSVIVIAKGYKPIGQDGFFIGPDDPDPYDIPIALTK